MWKGLNLLKKARIPDVSLIQKMLGGFASEGKLLARSLSELYTNIRDMFVYVDDETGEVAGCCSLHIIWENLAEIRSLAVRPSHQKKGVGRDLVSACLSEARDLGIGQLFTLTYEVEFFERMGFRVVDKQVFPQKIWADCLHCPKFPECDEVALVIDL